MSHIDISKDALLGVIIHNSHQTIINTRKQLSTLSIGVAETLEDVELRKNAINSILSVIANNRKRKVRGDYRGN